MEETNGRHLETRHASGMGGSGSLGGSGGASPADGLDGSAGPVAAIGKDDAFGRFLSYVLRHNPAAAGIALDAHGWADVQALLAGCARAGKAIDRDALALVVRENEKQRYSFNSDGTKIRANQGHSIAVDVELAEAEPPGRLYHGTARHRLPGIREAGIRRRSRRHVHLTDDVRTAIEVGNRHGEAVLLQIDAAGMRREGHRFYLSANGVWLCDYVPPSCIAIVPEHE
ncbi:RNA 2'-phosphotransferase [Paenibacillus lycopersici]|nr:RNA 2'-phosphotransferase [Paenibacillus lycopersici]